MKGYVNGLCGFYNGLSDDDKTRPDGELAKTTVEFGDSWRNPSAKECSDSICSIEIQEKALAACSIARYTILPQSVLTGQ